MRIWSNSVELLKHRLRAIHGEEVSRILDVGGTNKTVALLQDVFPRATIYCLNIARDRLWGPEGRVQYVHADGMVLPVRSRSIDLVFAREVLEHLLYPDRFVAEVRRVLRPGGQIVVLTPNLGAWHNRILLALGYSPTNYTPLPGRNVGLPRLLRGRVRARYDHPRVFTYRGLRELFSSDGFEMVEMWSCNNDARSFSFRRLRRLLNLLPPSWREDVYIRARGQPGHP